MNSSTKHWTDRAKIRHMASAGNFNLLVKLEKLNPNTDFQNCDFSSVDFGGANLRGYDFARSRFFDATFDGALIGPGLDFCGETASHARFDEAVFSSVSQLKNIHSDDARVKSLNRLAQANDYMEYALHWTPREIALPNANLDLDVIFHEVPFMPMMVVTTLAERTIAASSLNPRNQ